MIEFFLFISFVAFVLAFFLEQGALVFFGVYMTLQTLATRLTQGNDPWFYASQAFVDVLFAIIWASLAVYLKSVPLLALAIICGFGSIFNTWLVYKGGGFVYQWSSQITGVLIGAMFVAIGIYVRQNLQ